MVTARCEKVVAHTEASRQGLHSISSDLPLLSLSGLSSSHATWMGGFSLPVVRVVSLALQQVRSEVLFAQALT